MKAASSEPSQDDAAKSEMDLDYSEFFSVLMYYGHMSKEDIMNSSRPFLYGIYNQYVHRACENLGVSPDGDKEEDNKTELKESDYPQNFTKIKDFKSTRDFLSEFKGQIPGLDNVYIDEGTKVIKEM